MAYNIHVPITPPKGAPGFVRSILDGIKNIPTHLHLGLFGSNKVPVGKPKQFPGRSLK